MNTLANVLAAVLVLLAPYREGGREPLALFVLHLVAIAYAIAILRRGVALVPVGAPGRRASLLALAGCACAAFSALRASYPLAAWLGLVDLIVVLLILVASINQGGTARHAEVVRVSVVAAGLIQAWLVFARYPGGGVAAAGATFLNPNHLAAFLNVGALAAMAAADGAWPARRRQAAGWGVAAAVMLVAGFLLASRGGLLGLTAATVTLVLLRWKGWPRRVRVVACVLLLAAAAAGSARIASRFAAADDPFRYHRLPIWAASMGMIVERPALGFGPGLFPHVASARNFPAATGPLRYERRFEGAHSAPLTLAAEIGVSGAALLLAAVGAVAWGLLRGRPGAAGDDPSRAADPAVARGAALALVALLAHGCVEDLHRRPALILTPALLAGAALGSRGGRRTATRPLPAAGFAAARATALVYFAVLGIVLPYAAHREARAAHDSGARGLERMRHAARLNPLHPEYRHDLAMAVLNSGPPTAERYAEAWRLLEEARRLKPIDHRFPLLLGRLEHLAGEQLFVDAAAGERAEALYREAVRLAPLDPRPRLELAHHLLDRGKTAAALSEIRLALEVEPHYIRARILEASTLLRLGRTGEAREARSLLDRTLGTLEGFEPQSGYAREILQDAPAARARVDEELGGPEAPETVLNG